MLIDSLIHDLNFFSNKGKRNILFFYDRNDNNEEPEEIFEGNLDSAKTFIKNLKSSINDYILVDAGIEVYITLIYNFKKAKKEADEIKADLLIHDC